LIAASCGAIVALLLAADQCAAQTNQVDLRRALLAHWPVVEAPFEVAAGDAPRFGTGEFSLAVWMQSDEVADRLPGDLVSQYDPACRRGFHLTLKSNPGVTTNQANWRHLQFGIDDDRVSPWRDCGQPGNALLAFALTVHEGNLYAGTCEPGKNESGRVYRYDSAGNQWLDCGAPDASNAVMALAEYQGHLYAGTGKYRLAGSALPESENPTLGGRVFRYDGDTHWTDCGQLSETEAVGGLVVYRGQLYASSLYRPAGLFRFDGPSNWCSMPVPQGTDPDSSASTPRRVEALMVHEGFLYASSYDGGHVYRFDGRDWTDCGQLGDNTQTYSFAQYEGRLYTGTWPSGRVYCWDEATNDWTDVGRLGEEREVMGMLVHNGRLLAGTLPLAEVYSYEDGDTWKRLTRLDDTPDVTYRRAWTMAEHDGEVFCSTLPSGRVFAFSAGRQVAWEHTLSSAWHHVVAVKSADRLALYIDGRRVAETAAFQANGYLLDNYAPLRVGNGMNGLWNGCLRDVRIYQRTLDAAEIEALAKSPPE
jgi:outer membrane protein assembly factor BamB